MAYYSAFFDVARFDYSYFDTIIYGVGEPVVSTELVKPKIYNEEVVPKETTILIKPKIYNEEVVPKETTILIKPKVSAS